ncbi:hypothetical protein HWV07_01840 [Natronomonas salina]|uniref:DUF7344 domain-containing protein n=1 Tax=Natronomonas salina TaxID=1710540 RepID=UPI0015B5D4AD|nr:hypothetical protein [Natronomonas salina]QLD87845.1 hypothetical protein HWV07_01840 [Natronomonas salina]
MEIDLSETDAAEERCYEALADEDRRTVLSALCESGTALSLSELAIELAQAEPGPTEIGGGDAVERHEIELYHRHLPKLDDIGLVDFDQDRRLVSLTAEFDDADDATELLVA